MAETKTMPENRIMITSLILCHLQLPICSMGLEYLLTFRINVSQMYVNIPYMEHLGLRKSSNGGIVFFFSTCEFL